MEELRPRLDGVCRLIELKFKPLKANCEMRIVEFRVDFFTIELMVRGDYEFLDSRVELSFSKIRQSQDRELMYAKIADLLFKAIEKTLIQRGIESLM